jgi:hypothetical protein
MDLTDLKDVLIRALNEGTLADLEAIAEHTDDDVYRTFTRGEMRSPASLVRIVVTRGKLQEMGPAITKVLGVCAPSYNAWRVYSTEYAAALDARVEPHPSSPHQYSRTETAGKLRGRRSDPGGPEDGPRAKVECVSREENDFIAEITPPQTTVRCVQETLRSSMEEAQKLLRKAQGEIQKLSYEKSIAMQVAREAKAEAARLEDANAILRKSLAQYESGSAVHEVTRLTTEMRELRARFALRVSARAGNPVASPQ